MTRALLAPLQLVYAAALHARNGRYEKTAPLRLRRPVVSVGNLSVGGSGKTPLVIRLAELLEREGWKADVLSRGYGRSSRAAERVDPGSNAGGAAARFGDEPLLIAQAAQVPVFVAASRYEAGVLAEREIPPALKQVHLLDDGFQHRQLARAVDIVLVGRGDLKERLLPAGRLREPLAALQRARIIVLRDEDAELRAGLEPYTRPGTFFWSVRRKLSLLGEGKRIVAFCGIARPQEFFQALQKEGAEGAEGAILAGTRSFRDHHRYTQRDMEELARLGARSGCEGFVTTEKDAVKLDAELRKRLVEVAPLRVARLSLEILEEAAAMEQLIAMLEPLDPLREG